MTPIAFDAIVLAGGRSSRLGGTPKAELTREGQTLLTRALVAAAGARRLAIVGETGREALPADAVLCREFPAFGGPVAGIAAGLAALSGGADRVLVLGCDMPGVGEAAGPLLLAAETGPTTADALIAHPDGDQPQPLAALYRREALEAVLADGSAAGRSMRSVLAQLRWEPVLVPAGSCDDVDTWEDAARLGWEG
ncbi:molybdenum cofactor guanylyltransferase [Leifsonia sp. AG29]|uniref:molybdenum cofactor guanylyltransferase n=1 Tax=Leifsonia sp. AG29 TaxID=2598860 RepID=UPI001E2AE3AF|nr:NTP transferase domain-containing protein [Leifsonia sp. AG29]